MLAHKPQSFNCSYYFWKLYTRSYGEIKYEKIASIL